MDPIRLETFLQGQGMAGKMTGVKVTRGDRESRVSRTKNIPHRIMQQKDWKGLLLHAENKIGNEGMRRERDWMPCHEAEEEDGGKVLQR